MKAYLKEQFSK